MKKVLYFVVAILTVASFGSSFSQAQTRSRSVAASSPNLLASLPESDAIALIKIRRALNEAMPRMLATNPAKLADANAEIERFKTRTGLDPRAFEQVAVGIRFTYPSEGITKLQTAGLARGTFNSGAIVAAGRMAANGKYREEKYQGKPIYIFTLDQPVKLFGLIKFNVKELAVAPLDANTLAIGDPLSIHNLIDVGRGRKRANPELIALASRDTDAIVGFGANVSPTLLQNLDIGNETIAKDLSSVRQVFGSIGLTERDVEMFLAARTQNADSARNLGDTLEGLKQFGALFVNRMPFAKGALAKSALGNLRITTQANELQIRTAVAQADLVPLMGG